MLGRSSRPECVGKGSDGKGRIMEDRTFETKVTQKLSEIKKEYIKTTCPRTWGWLTEEEKKSLILAKFLDKPVGHYWLSSWCTTRCFRCGIDYCSVDDRPSDRCSSDIDYSKEHGRNELLAAMMNKKGWMKFVTKTSKIEDLILDKRGTLLNLTLGYFFELEGKVTPPCSRRTKKRKIPT